MKPSTTRMRNWADVPRASSANGWVLSAWQAETIARLLERAADRIEELEGDLDTLLLADPDVVAYLEED